MNPTVYVDTFLADNTKYKSVFNAWNRDEFSIVVYKSEFWWIETRTGGRGLSDRTYRLIKREMKRLFPNLKHYAEV